MNWQPIETFDALPAGTKLLKRCVFLFAATEPKRSNGHGFPPLLKLERIAGNRVCTHWCELPELPK